MPPSLWSNRGLRHKRVGASFAFGRSRLGPLRRWRLLNFQSPKPLPCWHMGFLCFGAREAAPARAWGPLSRFDHEAHRVLVLGALWNGNHRGLRCVSVGAAFSLAPRRPPPQGCGGLLRVCIIDAPVLWTQLPPSLGDHKGHFRKVVEASVESGSFWRLCVHGSPKGRFGAILCDAHGTGQNHMWSLVLGHNTLRILDHTQPPLQSVES